MGKLHEVLAVERSLEAAAKKVMDETVHVFKKPDLFLGATRQLTMFDTDRANENLTEESQVTTTVPARIDYTLDHMAPYLDAVYQKDQANMQASGDIVVDGQVIAEHVPATFLLGLETKLVSLRKVFDDIPTLQSGRNWQKAESMGEFIWAAQAPDTFKTQKDYEFRIAAPATKEHKAQVEKLDVTKNVGRYTTTVYSGMVTSAEKSRILGRLDKLINAVRQARQRANMVETANRTIAAELFAYILGE